MRTARIKLDGHCYYLVMTHLVAGAPLMGPAEKEQFRNLMRVYETFCGLRVLNNGRDRRLQSVRCIECPAYLDPIRKGHAAETGNVAAPGKAWRARPGR